MDHVALQRAHVALLGNLSTSNTARGVWITPDHLASEIDGRTMRCACGVSDARRPSPTSPRHLARWPMQTDPLTPRLPSISILRDAYLHAWHLGVEAPSNKAFGTPARLILDWHGPGGEDDTFAPLPSLLASLKVKSITSESSLGSVPSKMNTQ